MPKGLVRQCRHLQALCSSFTPSILYHPLENCLSPPQSLQFPHFQRPWVLPAATPGSIQSHFLDMTFGETAHCLRAAKLCAEIMREVNKTSLGALVLKCQCRKEETAVQSVSTRETLARWGSRFACSSMINLHLWNERATKARHVLDVS